MRGFWYRLKSTGTVILSEEKNLFVRMNEHFREGCLSQRTESFRFTQGDKQRRSQNAIAVLTLHYAICILILFF
jgi:hypothetical protein